VWNHARRQSCSICAREKPWNSSTALVIFNKEVQRWHLKPLGFHSTDESPLMTPFFKTKKAKQQLRGGSAPSNFGSLNFPV
jgi:hypothetical protein